MIQSIHTTLRTRCDKNLTNQNIMIGGIHASFLIMMQSKYCTCKNASQLKNHQLKYNIYYNTRTFLSNNTIKT